MCIFVEFHSHSPFPIYSFLRWQATLIFIIRVFIIRVLYRYKFFHGFKKEFNENGGANKESSREYIQKI